MSGTPCYHDGMGTVSHVLRSVRTAILAIAFWIASAVAGAGVGLAVAGCAGAATPAQRGSYAVEVARCIANERAIIDGDLPQAEAIEALDIERARCDNALEAVYQEPPK